MAEYFEIHDEPLSVLREQVVVITGAASGIGLATTEFLLARGAKVVAGDLNACPIEHDNLAFQTTNVTSWTDLTSLFSFAHKTHGRIDHVFANAGIGDRANYIDLKTDESGQLVEPSRLTLDVNLNGMINTCALAFHHMRTQQPPGGSVVVTASASSFQRFSLVDYAAAKHGVLGFMRGMVPVLAAAELAIRINGIAPSWTRTGLVPDGLTEAAGKISQSAEVVAKGAAALMADKARNGHFLYIVEGKYKEIDESILLKANKAILEDGLDDNTVRARMLALVEEGWTPQKSTGNSK